MPLSQNHLILYTTNRKPICYIVVVSECIAVIVEHGLGPGEGAIIQISRGPPIAVVPNVVE